MIWSLQILRFIAALMVVYVHSSSLAFITTGSGGFISHDLANTGRAGVDIFFVLSGVVISLSAKGLTSQQFLWRRVRRILPIYWVACAPAVVSALSIGISWREMLASVFLWPATDVMTQPLLQVSWTLTFEMLFYLSAALVLSNRRWLYALLGLYALAFCLRPLGPVFRVLGNPLVVEFLLGVIIARAPPRRWAVVGLPIGVAVLTLSGLFGVAPSGAILPALNGEENIQRVCVYGLPAAMIVYGTMQIEGRKSIWTYAGDMSYSLYLFHLLAVMLLLNIFRLYPTQPDLTVVVAMLASVLLSWCVHELIERPILWALPSDINSVRF
jgi:exopolysaccharide production protein ExoZ